MSTAEEIQMGIQHFAAEIGRFADEIMKPAVNDAITVYVHHNFARQVCAKRARKLRKRGDDVRYAGRTSTGKARYSWFRRIRFGWEVSARP